AAFGKCLGELCVADLAASLLFLLVGASVGAVLSMDLLPLGGGALDPLLGSCIGALCAGLAVSPSLLFDGPPWPLSAFRPLCQLVAQLPTRDILEDMPG
ncbi:unnamed protein product, partial [Polarella glacialis]